MSNYGSEFQSKESIIQNFISTINFNDPKLDMHKVKRDLTVLLHEEPGIKIDWMNEKTVNEISGKEISVEKVASVKVYYTLTNAEGKIVPKSSTFYGLG